MEDISVKLHVILHQAAVIISKLEEESLKKLFSKTSFFSEVISHNFG